MLIGFDRPNAGRGERGTEPTVRARMLALDTEFNARLAEHRLLVERQRAEARERQERAEMSAQIRQADQWFARHRLGSAVPPTPQPDGVYAKLRIGELMSREQFDAEQRYRSRTLG